MLSVIIRHIAIPSRLGRIWEIRDVEACEGKPFGGMGIVERRLAGRTLDSRAPT
jgi:hypothetical protein